MSVPDDVRQWYEAHGMEAVPEDWGARSEVGESAGNQRATWAEGVRKGTIVGGMDERRLEQLESMGLVEFLWEQREDHEVLSAIEEFFAPYLSAMPYAKRRVIDEYIYGRKSQRAIAETLGVSQPNVSKQLRRAIHWLVSAIADAQPGAGLYDDEELAWEAFNAFWERRFGTPWPLRG